MIRDDNGIAAPHEMDPLPWKYNQDIAAIVEKRGDVAIMAQTTSQCTCEFAVHAANYHAQLADIVRRLAEPNENAGIVGLIRIIEDARNLWAEMMQEGGE